MNYTLKDLSMICGLTDRTLRNYLKLGILTGEKQDGTWCFTEEHLDAFFKNDVASAAMQAKRNAAVFDFLKDTKKKTNYACVILDLPQEQSLSVAKFFCEAVSKRQNMTMSFESRRGINRVILTGEEIVIHDIMLEYHSVFA